MIARLGELYHSESGENRLLVIDQASLFVRYLIYAERILRLESPQARFLARKRQKGAAF